MDECIDGAVSQTSGGGVAFRHELARLAVLAAIAPARRRELHRRALLALDKPPTAGPDLSRLARHAEEAADPAAIIPYAPLAAGYANTVEAHWAAAAHVAAALRYADRLTIVTRADLYSRLAHESNVTGELVEAVRASMQPWTVFA